MILKLFNKTIAVFLTAIFIFGLIPVSVFAQPNQSSLSGEVKGFNRSVFDSHFSRADREISPERWLAEAKLGVSQALYAWELTASGMYDDPLLFEEEKNKVEKWSDEELEKRFSQWLIGRFFGEVKEKALMNLSSSLGEIQKSYSWHLDAEGNIIFDDNTGDPLIIRPDDDGREFSSDLLKWRSEADEIVKTSGVSFDAVMLKLYPELLGYIPEEMYETIRAIINETGASVSTSIKREFENIAAREERIFTSRRTSDIWSLRRKNDDEAAKLFTEKLIAETEETCNLGIEEIKIRIEQAEAGTGDLALMGEEWLRLYREQFEKGLKAWEEAEERFFIRRIEWEQESFRLFSEGEEIWLAAFSQFEEGRQKWESKARELFQSGETLFKNLSEDFQKTIAEAKKEFEANMQMRIGAGTTKVKALIDMYLVCASASVSMRDNIVFWLRQCGISEYEDPASPDFTQFLWNERKKIWETLEEKYIKILGYKMDVSTLENLKRLSEVEYDPKKIEVDIPVDKETGEPLLSSEEIEKAKYQKYLEEKKNAEDKYNQYLEAFNSTSQILLYIQDIIGGKITYEDEIAFANENIDAFYFGNINIDSFSNYKNYFDSNKHEKLVEIQKSYDVYISYLDKALDTRERILANYAELISDGVVKDILSPDASTEDFYLDEYQLALVRAKALVLYWERKTVIAEAVMTYAEDLSAGRMTEAEGIRAWEDAKAAYNESLAVYESELKKLNALGDDVHNQQKILDTLSSDMTRAEEKLNKLNSDYSVLLNISVIDHAEHYLSELKEKYNSLVKDYKLFLETGADAAYRTALEYGLQWALSKQNEDAAAALEKLLNGDKEEISLAELEEQAALGLIPEIELKLRLAGIDLLYDKENEKPRSSNSDYSGADWYEAAKGLILSANEKAALYGDKLKERLIADYKNSSSLLLEKRLEFELEALINFLKEYHDKEEQEHDKEENDMDELDNEDHDSADYEYSVSDFCLLDADTAAEVLEILINLKERISQGKNIYTENDDENIYIDYFISGGSFFTIQPEDLSLYYDEYSFCIGLLDVYIEYEAVSSFGQKEAWAVTRNSLTSLFANYGINQTGSFLPDAASIFAAISKRDGDLVQNTAEFVKDFDNCFATVPQWLEYEKENWKNAFMKYAAANVFRSGISPEKTLSDIYFEEEELLSDNEALYLYAYSQYYIEDNEMEKINDALLEIRNDLLTLNYMGKIMEYLDFFDREEKYAGNEKHWRSCLEGRNFETDDSEITIVSTWREGVLADALFAAVYSTNRINDSFALFLRGGDAKTEQSAALSRNQYLEEASKLGRKFNSLEYQYDDIARLGRAYDFTQLEVDEIKIQKEIIFEELAEQEAIFNELREKYFIEAENFLVSGLLYDEQYSVLKTAHDYTDQRRFEYEKQDAIRRWASTAYLDKETIDPQYCKAKLVKAQTVMAVLSDIYNDEKNQSYSDPQYNALYSEYEISFGRKLKILDAMSSFLSTTEEEKNRNETIFKNYRASLNNLGYVDINYLDYYSPEESKYWTVKDIITVKDSKLAFNRNDLMNLSGIDDSTKDSLNEFFGGDDSKLSAYEESLLALSQRMSGYFADKEKLIKWSLARDHLILLLMNANEGIAYLAENYTGLGDMEKNGKLGGLQVKPGIKIFDNARDLYKLLTEDQWVNPFSKLFFTPNEKFEDYEKTLRMAWEELSAEEQADLEYYIILTLSGNEYSAGFSQIHTLDVYELAYNYVEERYSYAKKQRSKRKNFLVFWAYDRMIDINRSALKNITPAYETAMYAVDKWKNGITKNLSTIQEYYSSYKDSSEKLAAMQVKKENGQDIAWDDISDALRYVGDLKPENIEEIRIFWEKTQETSTGNFTNLDDALKGLLQWARNAEESSRINLETYRENSAKERLKSENNFQAAVETYLAGTGNANDLKAAAEKAYGNNAVLWKNHLANMHTALMNDLSLYTGTEKNFYGEFNALGDELVMLTEKALANRFSMELAAREIEWNYMLRDIEDKYSEWRNSAALIFENGRADWNTGYQKMQEAYREWTKNFEEEYNRVNEEWTMAYLAGLDDKEKWLEQAAAAANHASEESTLALLGAEGERLSRLVDTREPLGIRDAVPQAQNLMAELLQSSGIVNMVNAFGAMNNISSTASTVVKRGMGGVSAWDAVLVKSAAADLAKKANAEVAAAEAKKLAYTAQTNANQIIESLSENVRMANQNFRESMDNTFTTKGLWRRSGNNYVKDVVKGSTLFDPVISESVTITGYTDYIMEPVSLQTNLDENVLSTLDSYTIQELIQSVMNEVKAYSEEIFGKKDEKPKLVEKKGDTENPRTQSPGYFGAHIGYEPDRKTEIKEIKRNSIYHDEGAGELGRLLADFIYWDMIDSMGKAEQALPNWDKRMWDDTDSFFTAPTIRSIGQIAGSIAAAALTGGLGIIGTIALTAVLSSASDLVFGTLDAAFGYKAWDEAGFEMGKSLLMNTATSAIGVGFNGVKSTAETAFKGFTDIATNSVNNSIGKVLVKTAMTGTQTALTSLTTSAISGITYNSEDKWGYNTNAFYAGTKNMAGSVVSSMASTFTTSSLQLINSGLDMKKLTNLNKTNIDDIGKFNSLAGSLAGQAVNSAFGNDFTLNLLNLSLLNIDGLESGLLELHLGRDGAKMNIGTGGANISIDNLAAAFRGAQVWNVNSQIKRFANNDISMENALRYIYGYGDDLQKSQLWNILRGNVEIPTGKGKDLGAETTIDNKKRVTNLTDNQSDMIEKNIFDADETELTLPIQAGNDIIALETPDINDTTPEQMNTGMVNSGSANNDSETTSSLYVPPQSSEQIPTQPETKQSIETSKVNSDSRENQSGSQFWDGLKSLFRGGRDLLSSLANCFIDGLYAYSNGTLRNQSRQQETNQTEPNRELNNQYDRGDYVTVPEGFFDNIMNDDIKREYSKANKGYLACNEYVRDVIRNNFGIDTYNRIFPNETDNANQLFLSFKDNQNLERINPYEFEGGVEAGLRAIQGMADAGILIILSTQVLRKDKDGKDIPGHIAFIGRSDMRFDTKYETTPYFNGQTISDLNTPSNWVHLVVIQAGVYPGTTSIVYTTDGYLKPEIRDDLLRNSLYFYAVRRPQ